MAGKRCAKATAFASDAGAQVWYPGLEAIFHPGQEVQKLLQPGKKACLTVFPLLVAGERAGIQIAKPSGTRETEET